MKEPAYIKTTFQNTYGLVLCGGQSKRMRTDKSMLQYFDKPQRYHVYDMLVPFCDKVFISCNAIQANNIEAGYNFNKDDEMFGGIGPIAALLSVFTQYPNKNILLVGCDYPFLNANELQLFSSQCKDVPAAFYNEADDVYEPMLAWYPFTCFEELKRVHKAMEFSLQHFLKINHAIKHFPTNNNCIQSIDTPQRFKAAYKLLNGR